MTDAEKVVWRVQMVLQSWRRALKYGHGSEQERQQRRKYVEGWLQVIEKAAIAALRGGRDA